MEVVPALDVLKYGHPGFGLCAVVSATQAFAPITSEVPGRKSTGPGPSHFAHVPPVLWRSRPPFPGFRKKVAHGPDLCPQRCLELATDPRQKSPNGIKFHKLSSLNRHEPPCALKTWRSVSWRRT